MYNILARMACKMERTRVTYHSVGCAEIDTSPSTRQE